MRNSTAAAPAKILTFRDLLMCPMVPEARTADARGPQSCESQQGKLKRLSEKAPTHVRFRRVQTSVREEVR
jgi:hypothetical protein